MLKAGNQLLGFSFHLYPMLTVDKILSVAGIEQIGRIVMSVVGKLFLWTDLG